jgi:hypothetical protein
MPRHATITIKSDNPLRACLEKFPSAGPHCNIMGMKKLYWGVDAYCIKCGVYVYSVDKATYNKF